MAEAIYDMPSRDGARHKARSVGRGACWIGANRVNQRYKPERLLGNGPSHREMTQRWMSTVFCQYPVVENVVFLPHAYPALARYAESVFTAGWAMWFCFQKYQLLAADFVIAARYHPYLFHSIRMLLL